MTMAFSPLMPNQFDVPWLCTIPTFSKQRCDIDIEDRRDLKRQWVAIQLLEYQTDVRRWRFDTLGKLTPAHRAGQGRGSKKCSERWVDLLWRWRSNYLTHPPSRGTLNCSRTMGAPAHWAGVNFPRVSNLQLRTSVWYFSNWIAEHWPLMIDPN